ncbi:hypothetical protein SAMN05518849_102367 [Sphingobium sp. AP50]|uniref:hypothetical protein n=1 Tax=Sphingobium sp. AP50 TaxID=1884369 RepID=UPI0008CA2681|nr:hypothetical protein [Sphingobium sp. AP50]SEJ05962.1 hypothetical protein SAMN05518849_102367 [Sphingobium sp. AP50]
MNKVDIADAVIIPNLPWIIGGGLLIGAMAVAGWIFTTWLRVRHGYPLENSWGKAVYPQKNEEMVERIKLLSQENAQLRAEIGSMKDRLIVVERIVTDSSHQLTREIEQLRSPAN